MAQNSLIQFDSSATPAVISYDVPEGVFYSGRHYIDLQLDASYFSLTAKQQLTYKLPPADGSLTPTLATGMVAGFFSDVPCDVSKGVTPPSPPLDWYFPGIPSELVGRLKLTQDGSAISVVAGMNDDGSAQLMNYQGVYLDNNGTLSIEQLSIELQTLTSAEIVAALKQGRYLRVYQGSLGQYTYTFIPVPPAPIPRLAIVEEYRLTTFPGKYGIGRTLKTMSLLPGEKTNISIKTYTRRTEIAKEASSIFDSASQETAADFQYTVESENTDKEASANSTEWQVEAKVTGRWGVGHASLSAGVSGAASSAREQFNKGVHGAAKKHADKASSKRDVSVEQASETRTESGEELGTMREVQNINVGRSLNFVFRQLNQEYISLLHLVDVRIAFANGMPGADRIVPLAEIDDLLKDIIVDGPVIDLEANRKKVKDFILRQLDCVIDYQGVPRSVYETRSIKVSQDPKDPGGSYYRIKRDLSSYTDAGTGSTFRVPGTIVSIDRNVLRTDGLIVETLLGQASGLDGYSTALQLQAIEAKTAANNAVQNQVALEQAKQNIVSQKLDTAAQAFVTMFPPSAPPLPATSTPGKTS